MKHIFYIHSNICTISVFDTIQELVKKNEKVIIVSLLNTNFPLVNKRIEFYSLDTIIEKYRKDSNNVISKFLNYKYEYLPPFSEAAKSVIAEENFYIYIPTYNLFYIRPYLNSKYCKGYYYIEEGFMSYASINALKWRYFKRQILKGHIFLKLFGIGEKFEYTLNNKFKGCISLSEHAFPWYSGNKIINGVSNYMSYIIEEPENFDYMIVTDWMEKDLNVIEKGFDYVLQQIASEKPDPHIGIKMHPTAYSYQKEKINKLIEYINRFYPKLRIKYLPSPYCVEFNLFYKETNIYSIFGMSSLLLYACVFGSKSYVIQYNEGKIDCSPFYDVKSVLDFISNYKY